MHLFCCKSSIKLIFENRHVHCRKVLFNCKIFYSSWCLSFIKIDLLHVKKMLNWPHLNVVSSIWFYIFFKTLCTQYKNRAKYQRIVINTNMKSDPADQERSSSPIVFYQDDDIPELICSPDDFECQRTKSILKPPRSPKISLNRIRINVVPEVREIENVLDQEDGDPEETHHPEKQVRTLSEGESPEPEVAPIPAPRKRSWAKVWSWSM